MKYASLSDITSLLEQNLFPWRIFWGLPKASSRWGPDLENSVSAEAIRSGFHVVFAINAIDLWHGALSWWTSTFFVFIWGYFFFFFAISSSKCYIIFAIGGPSFLKEIDEQNILPADVHVFCHFGRLSRAVVHLADNRFDPGVKWWINVSSIVTYLRENSFLLRWNIWKQRSESSMCCYFLIGKITHFEHNFFIDKCSRKIVKALPSDIFNYSAISHNFNVQPAKMSLWIFLVFSRTDAEFGWPERLVSLVSVRLRIKSAYYLLTVVSNGTESE